MVHFTGLLENARHPVGGPCRGTLLGDPCKNCLPARIGGWPGSATGGQIHVVPISHTHPPKELIEALRKYLLGKTTAKNGKRFSNKSNLSAARPDFCGFKTPADLLTRRAIWDCPKISSVRTNLRIFRSSELIIKEVETDCSLFVSFFARRSANRCVASLRSCFSKL